MLKLFCAITFIFLAISGYSQVIDNNYKVKDFLGEEIYENSLEGNPGLLKFLNYKLQHGYSIDNLVEKKDNYLKVHSVSFIQDKNEKEISCEEFLERSTKESFNFLLYGFPNSGGDENGYFILGDTGMVISIYSNAYINSKIIK